METKTNYALVVKVSALGFSSALTLSLFIRLFGWSVFGGFMAVSALALFEGAALGWSNALDTAREGQRRIARSGLALTVLFSLVSSVAEIVLATKLGAEKLAVFDMGFLSLLVIAAALSTSVVCGFAYKHADPETAKKHREKDFDAEREVAKAKMTHRVLMGGLDKAESDSNLNAMIDRVAPEVQEQITAEVEEMIRRKWGNGGGTLADEWMRNAHSKAKAENDFTVNSTPILETPVSRAPRQSGNAGDGNVKDAPPAKVHSKPKYTVNGVLAAAGMSLDEARRAFASYADNDASKAFEMLSSRGKIPSGMSRSEFIEIASEIIAPKSHTPG